MTTYLVTGASGLVGQAILHRLASRGRAVGTALRHGGGQLHTVDLRDRAAVKKLLDEVKPDAVVHAAANPDPDSCEDKPAEARRLNVDSTRWLRELLPAHATLALISTDYVFDGSSAPYRETDPVHAINVYGQTKVEAEAVLAGRPHSLVIRIPLQVGPPPASGKAGFIAQMWTQLNDPRPASVDDVLVRVPTWTADVANALEFLLTRHASGTYHVSSPHAGTRWYWTQELARLRDRSTAHLTPSTTVIPRRAARPVDGKLVTDKLRTLGWDRYTPFADMVQALGLR